MRDWIPPALLPWLKLALGKTTLYGNFTTWREALQRSGNYQTDFEYFSAALDVPLHYQSWPVAVGVLMSEPKVLDFGGGIGRLYFELKPFVKHYEWRVVDLPEVVEYGNKHLADGKISYHASIEEALSGFQPDVVVAAGVVEYLEHPYEVMRQLSGIGARIIVLNRTPVRHRDRIMAQRMHPKMGGTRHPFRLLDEHKLMACAWRGTVCSLQSSGGMRNQWCTASSI